MYIQVEERRGEEEREGERERGREEYRNKYNVALFLVTIP